MSGILSSVSITGAQARKNTSKRGARSGGNAALRRPWKTAVERLAKSDYHAGQALNCESSSNVVANAGGNTGNQRVK